MNRRDFLRGLLASGVAAAIAPQAAALLAQNIPDAAVAPEYGCEPMANGWFRIWANFRSGDGFKRVGLMPFDLAPGWGDNPDEKMSFSCYVRKIENGHQVQGMSIEERPKPSESRYIESARTNLIPNSSKWQS